MSDEKKGVLIQVTIANKKFPIMANNEEEEEVYRAASKRITDTIKKYQEKYGTQADPLDFLYLAAFQHTLALIREEKRNNTGPIVAELEKIGSRIDEFVKE